MWQSLQVKTWFWWLLLAALAGLLLALAALQYRWLDQVSKADRERRQAALTTAAKRFSEDFDREVTRALMAFQIDAESVRRRDWAAYAARYDQWQNRTEFPQLIKAIYLIPSDPGQNPTSVKPFVYEQATGRFVECAWPPALTALQRQLEQRAQALPAGVGGIIHPELIPLPGEFPGLVNPIIPLPPRAFTSGAPPLRVNSVNTDRPFLSRPVATTQAVRLPVSQGYSVILLDQTYLRRVLLPGLAHRYFAGASGWDYHLRIVSRDAPHQLIFAPDDSSLPTTNGEADATGNLFSLRFDLIENQPFGSVTFSTGRMGNFRQDEARTEIGVAFSASPAAPFPVGGATVIQHGVAGMQAGALWQFTLRHRSGSLEKAITQARQRNLLVSFGVLLLLAASMALVLVLTARARRLAAQQLEFIAGVSHELRTPVSAVCVASANLADGMIRGDEQVRLYGKMIQTEGRRLSEMIEQVLDLAGTASVRRPYHLQRVPVAEPMQRALATLRQQSEGNGAKPLALECDLATDLPDLLADSRALERAFYNLLSNAAKYGGEVGWIRITARLADAGQLAIAIADRGLGIEPAELAQLFQPFWRGRAARATNLPGNGLGLCLVDRIVRAHSGRIIVNSVPGQGSTFTLYLPCVSPAAAEVE